MQHDPSTVYTRAGTPLGAVILAATPRGLSGMWFDGQRHQPDTSAWRRDDGHGLLREAAAQLGDYLAGRRAQFDLPLDLQGGTEFQQLVWQALRRIPRGHTVSYAHLSQQIGRPAAVRAVGMAIGRNPVSVIVPCHRVVGADGSLTGYAGGLDRKQALLRMEGALA